MNSKYRLSAIAMVALSMTLGACSTATDMDEMIDNTELNAPFDPNDGQGGGGTDDPIGGNAASADTLN